MATHSSTLTWKIPWMEEPGRLQSMGLLRVWYDRATSLSLFTFMHWRRKWQPIPVLSPGKSHGWRSLVGYSPWGREELNRTERHRSLTHGFLQSSQRYFALKKQNLDASVSFLKSLQYIYITKAKVNQFL